MSPEKGQRLSDDTFEPVSYEGTGGPFTLFIRDMYGNRHMITNSTKQLIMTEGHR